MNKGGGDGGGSGKLHGVMDMVKVANIVMTGNEY